MTRINIGEESTELRRQHKQEVYEALLDLRKKVKIKEIWLRLDLKTSVINQQTEDKIRAIYNSKVYNWTRKDMLKEIQQNKKKTIAKRTVERCIKEDPRILKDGPYYYIDDKTRFERRYQRPEFFGRDLLHELVGKMSIPPTISLEECTSDLIRRFGAIVVFAFIEASRPFEDKALSLRDRGHLVHYWAQNAVPLYQMFNYFQAILGNDKIHIPTSEIEKPRINEILKALENSNPDLYKDLLLVRREQPQVGPEGKDDEVIHGKTYHTGFADWMSYLEDMNPIAHKNEMKRLEHERTKRRWEMGRN